MTLDIFQSRGQGGSIADNKSVMFDHKIGFLVCADAQYTAIQIIRENTDRHHWIGKLVYRLRKAEIDLIHTIP